METGKQLQRFSDIRRVTANGKVYILRRKTRIETLRSENHNASEAKERGALR